MIVVWECKENDLKKIPEEILYGMDESWLTRNEGLVYFKTLDDAYHAIKNIYPLATYSMKINNSYIHVYIENFDNHLYELKGYRNDLNK